MNIQQLSKLIENADPDKIYVVGDSHALAVGGNLAGAEVLAENGANLDAISAQAQSVPDGVRVLMSGGANDWNTNSTVAAAKVSRALRDMKNRGIRSVYVAFPKIDLNGVHREVYASAGINLNYDRVQTATARAAQGILGANHVLALNMREINPSDPQRIHATPQAYQRIATAANSAFAALGSAQQRSNTDNLDPASIAVDVEALKPEDQALLDRDGDGIVSVADTQAAGISSDLFVQGGGGFAGIFSVLSNFLNKQEALEYTPQLNAALDRLRSQPNSGAARSVANAGASANAAAALKYFEDKGLSPAQSAGIVGNLQAESGVNLNPAAIGDGGAAWGIAQWHPDRRKIWEDATGKVWQEDGTSPGFAEQLQFIIYELNRTESRALRQLRSTETAAEAAASFDQYYERSSGAHRDRRIAYAEALMGSTSGGTQTADASGLPTNGDPLFGMDGASRMTQDDAAQQMSQTIAKYRRMVANLDFPVRINDAIAKTGTSRERNTPGSQHFHGTALDLSTRGLTNEQIKQMLVAAKAVGFTGFGFGNSILHVDSGPKRAWDYGNNEFAGMPVLSVQRWARA